MKQRILKSAVALVLVAVMAFGAMPLAGFFGVELPEWAIAPNVNDGFPFIRNMPIGGTGDPADNHNDPNELDPDDKIIEGYFSYESGYKNENGKCDIVNNIPYKYRDSYFSKTSYDYNHDLANMSLALALTTYDYNELSRVLTKIGFSDFEVNQYYKDSNTNKSKTEPNNIAVGIANKKIGDCTVLAVAVRGFGYESEWAGNFYVGGSEYSEYHNGFLVARNHVFSEIKKYVSEYASDENFSTENLKIWLTGYSRAGATANLVAGYLDEKICSGDIEYLLGASVRNEDVYTYCFEPPMGANSGAIKKGIDYKNIYNIINLNDLVPKVALSEWGFRRYGVDICLPSRETASNYDFLYKEMVSAYKDYSNNEEYHLIDHFFKNKITLKGIERYSFSQANFLNDLFISVNKGLKTFGFNVDPQDVYVLKYQDRIMELLEQFGFDIKLSAVSLVDVWDVLTLVQFIPANDAKTAADNLNGIAVGHYPDLALAWMKSLNSDYVNMLVKKQMPESGNTRIVKIECPVDVEVYDSQNDLVAKIVGDMAQEIAGKHITAYCDENDHKVFFLPYGESYTIKMSGTDDGTMNYTVSDYDMVYGETFEEKEFQNVTLFAGKTMTSEIGADADVEEVKLFVTDGDKIIAEVMEDGKEIKISNSFLDILFRIFNWIMQLLRRYWILFTVAAIATPGIVMTMMGKNPVV